MLRVLIEKLRIVLEAKANVVAPHPPDDRKHLRRVGEEMRKKGPPTVRAYWNGREWEAIEGAHRLAAAADLGLPVRIKPVKLDDVFSGLIGDPKRSEVSVADALEWFKEWSHPRRPVYNLDVVR